MHHVRLRGATAGETDEERTKNCKYVISVARKIGAKIYLSWQDIYDVKPKMIMCLVASIMSETLARRAAHK
jgi:hypothetical protein